MNFGIYCSNENHYDLPRFMELPWRSTVILHGAAERTFSTLNPHGDQADTPHNIIHVARFGFNEPGWRVAPAHPHANILLRHYHSPGWQHRNPREWARECAERAHLYHDYTVYQYLLNEPNLHIEGGAPASDQWKFRTSDWYRFIRDWFWECLQEFKRLVPWALVGSPGLASGHSDDQDDNGDGTIGLAIMRDMIRECDFFCHHDYWFEPQQALSEWYGMRWTKAMEIVGWDMPLWVDECGWFRQNESNPDAGRIYNDYFASSNWSRVQLKGACIFIWDSDNAMAGHRIARNPPLVDALQELLVTAYPIPIPPPLPADNPIIDYRQTLRDLGLVHSSKTFPRGSMDEVDAFVIHHVGAGDTGLPPTSVARYHVYTLGWPGAGYTWFVGGNGDIFQLNDLEAESYQVSGHNDHTRGICLAGNLVEDDPTPEQIAALEWLLTYLEEQYPGREVKAHYELGNTACCGRAWFEPWRASFLGSPGPDIPIAIENLNNADEWLTDSRVALITELANLKQVQVFVRDAKEALE